MDDVPAKSATVSPAVPTRPSPRKPMHPADVADVQLVVAQMARARTAVKVGSAGAKFMPVSVTLAEAEATLYGNDAVRTGADHDGQARWYALDEKPRCMISKPIVMNNQCTVKAEDDRRCADHIGYS